MLKRMGEIVDPSERLVEQRLRNRAMEALQVLSRGPDGVRAVGHEEFVNEFFDVIDDRSPWSWREWSCFTTDEIAALENVQRVLMVACAATPRRCSDEAFVESGWAARIQPVAYAALALMLQRGWFREDVEESQPSVRA